MHLEGRVELVRLHRAPDEGRASRELLQSGRADVGARRAQSAEYVLCRALYRASARDLHRLPLRRATDTDRDSLNRC